MPVTTTSPAEESLDIHSEKLELSESSTEEAD